MNTPVTHQAFSGTIAQFYQRYMVPMIFEPYAMDLAGRAAALKPSSVLEVAAGTGAVTRHLAEYLPVQVPLVATDLNPAMLALAEGLGASRAVTWREADAMQLPFEDKRFELVVCQFGYMFLQNKVAAFSEARRVLRTGGTLLFSVWDRIEDNAFADVVNQALAKLFPEDPPQFMARIPHGYHDCTAILDDLAQAGFDGANRLDTVTLQSRANSAREAALAFCQGTPLRNGIEVRDAGGLSKATDAAETALQTLYGEGPITGKMQAHIVTALRRA